MPCGDSSAFPTDAIKTIGNAFIAKQFTGDFVPAACDIACYVNTSIGGGAIPFPKPTFGAGIERPDDAEVESLGRTMLAAAEAHDDGAKRAIPWSSIPWGKILSVAFTIIQGVLVAAEPSPFPKPDVLPTPAPPQNG